MLVSSNQMMRTTYPIESVIDGLMSIPEDDFTCEYVYEYLASHPVGVDSIQKYLHWSEKFYTRNLIHKNERFEVMAICWEPGQVSRIHNHWDQKCWMTVPVGRLKGQNFTVVDIDVDAGRCRLAETDSFELSDCLTAKVELEEPIHQVLNLEEFEERAISIHIYSKPYDRCISYCRDTNTFKEVQLFYTSVDGKLCDGVEL